MTHEQVVNSGRIQFIVWNPQSNSFQRDFEQELWFTVDGRRRLWNAQF